jgi:hypothetical protein
MKMKMPEEWSGFPQTQITSILEEECEGDSVSGADAVRLPDRDVVQDSESLGVVDSN